MKGFTTPSQLFSAAKRINVPLKWVGSKDDFCVAPTNIFSKSKAEGYIVNLQSSDDGNGTHWVCVYIDPHAPKKAFYFDSFGADVPDSILRGLRGLKVVHGNKIIQDIHEGYCGEYCLYFLKKMNPSSRRSIDAEERYKMFQRIWYNDTKKNQEMIKYWSRMFLN